MPPLQGSLSLLLQPEIILPFPVLSKTSLLRGSACNGPLTGVRSCLHHLLAVWPCMSYLAFLCLHFQKGDNPGNCYFKGLLWELIEGIHAKHLKECLEHSNHSTGISFPCVILALAVGLVLWWSGYLSLFLGHLASSSEACTPILIVS